LESIEGEKVALSGYVAMELMQGCNNKIELQQIRRLIANFEVVWATAETCNQALEVFAEYKLSHSLGLIDALIGQTAISLGVPLRCIRLMSNTMQLFPISQLYNHTKGYSNLRFK
jgi:predicted nucleic acid-binding protein